MRATLTTVTVAAVLAAGAGPASARTDPPTDRVDAANHVAVMRAQGVHREQHLTDGASPGPAPAPIVRVTRVTDGGFDWADAGIGAGLAVALLLSASGASAVLHRHGPATR